jgi:choice-of-anchor B domain-containing protein
MPGFAFAARCSWLLAAAALLASCGGGGGGGGDDDTGTLQPPVGATLLANVPATGASGTWGYTAPDGARYALMGTARGVLVLDLRDAENPRVVDEVAGPTRTSVAGTWWREMRVHGSHAYIVSEHTDFRGGIMILDLSGLPNSVRYVRSVVPRDGQLAAHTLDIDTARGLLYLQRVTDLPAPDDAAHEHPEHAEAHPVGGPDDGSIELYDLADPENPAYLTTFNQHRSVHDMTAVGDFVYVAEGNAASYSVWNVQDPRAPTRVVRWSVGGFAHNVWPTGDGTHVVTTEEIPNGRPALVWRLDGGAAPTRVASIKVGTGTPHNVVIEGRRAHFSHYTEGYAQFDLDDPAAPRLVARLDTNGFDGPELGGCWGVYKFPGVPLALCSDTASGFNLIRVDAD